MQQTSNQTYIKREFHICRGSHKTKKGDVGKVPKDLSSQNRQLLQNEAPLGKDQKHCLAQVAGIVADCDTSVNGVVVCMAKKSCFPLATVNNVDHNLRTTILTRMGTQS